MGSMRDAKGPKGEAKFVLERDTNWMIENQDCVQELKVEQASMSHVIYISNCRKTVVSVNSAKVKGIIMDSCVETSVICNDVLSAVELVNSDGSKVWAKGVVNNFLIDKCAGVGIILSKESMNAEFVSSKSSEMNVTIPQDGDDSIEVPIPEQFVSTIIPGKNKLKTEVSA